MTYHRHEEDHEHCSDQSRAESVGMAMSRDKRRDQPIAEEYTERDRKNVAVTPLTSS